MQAGIMKNVPTKVFQIGNNAKEVCDHFGKAIRAGSKSGIQMSRENICKSIFSSVRYISRLRVYDGGPYTFVNLVLIPYTYCEFSTETTVISTCGVSPSIRFIDSVRVPVIILRINENVSFCLPLTRPLLIITRKILSNKIF